MTITPGFPLGESGEWRCVHCDGFLARVDASRGRLTVRCAKCTERVSATAADVFATLQADEKPAEPEPDDDFDDLPF
ncbi:hypothetical protein [Nitrolancea hollandica]|uniref:hypothetical protein n=1 Tax=Nitrolancea hollandica TaxID=1206749 RepID=UPI00135F10E9|nr:hypothetical protein [Nitrolancea hollandica]